MRVKALIVLFLWLAAGCSADLQELHASADLMVLQEAPRESGAWDDLLQPHFRSFAEGFGFTKSVTGVLTMSRVA